MRKVIPNLISTARLLLVVPLAPMLWISRHSDDWRYGVIVLFFLIALSDWLDGYLARKWSVQSSLGKLLDPSADKLLALVSFVIIVAAGRMGNYFPLPVWLVVLVVAKDVWTVLGYAVIRMMGIGLTVRPSRWGKASTFFQLSLIGAILVEPELQWLGLGWSLHVLLWMAAAATVAAAVDYTWMALHRLSSAQLIRPAGGARNNTPD